MKAYIIRITLEQTDPLIWRKVILPAGATFNMLHDIIQQTTNFQSGYPYEPYHLFAFDLPEDNIRVTNDEEAYEEHKFFVKNRKEFEERLKTRKPEHLEFEKRYQERLRTEVRKPVSLKIDEFLERNEVLTYRYDFGDGWEFCIELEDVVDDYHFGYPTLLDGAETAPPEDVGGVPGFYSFLTAYRDKRNPDHKEMKQWAESQGFKEYDPDKINERLKSRRYKKTEWDKIEHENYRIIRDKYRKK
ncbi:plasmid pRiA4b ORF-3 family protein [Indiicoccus explosivorum]|uniref:plasmid pRiA4b ORF-3 family protein n=1 Tax=Indiicoccus explosivorum TaxID=1917864 RepID=UPI000B434306|nr:plasmid pRiA4b ORF-3 family protein [Indiicoccus explosivorum]